MASRKLSCWDRRHDDRGMLRQAHVVTWNGRPAGSVWSCRSFFSFSGGKNSAPSATAAQWSPTTRAARRRTSSVCPRTTVAMRWALSGHGRVGRNSRLDGASKPAQLARKSPRSRRVERATTSTLEDLRLGIGGQLGTTGQRGRGRSPARTHPAVTECPSATGSASSSLLRDRHRHRLPGSVPSPPAVRRLAPGCRPERLSRRRRRSSACPTASPVCTPPTPRPWSMLC